MPLLYSWKGGKKKSNAVGKRVELAALVSFRTRKDAKNLHQEPFSANLRIGRLN